MFYYFQFYTAKTVIFFLEKLIDLFIKKEIYVDPSQFKWVPVLEQNYESIRAEYQAVADRREPIDVTVFSKEQLKSVERNHWTVFPLKAYGKVFPENCEKCPVTYACLQQIPDCTTAWFSIMKPDTYIKPHRGTYRGYLRCLMGVVIPDDKQKSGLEIGGKTYHWENGKCMIFDDTYIHSAYNHNQVERAVLYIDFIRPMPAFLVAISRFLTRLFEQSKYVRDMKFK